MCPHCGKTIGDDPADWRGDHRPALWLRDVLDDLSDYTPAQLDPRYIEVVHAKCHDERTFGAGYDRRGGDVQSAAKLKRVQAKQSAHIEKIAAKALCAPRDQVKRSPLPSRKMQSRPFGKQSRPMQSRGFAKKISKHH